MVESLIALLVFSIGVIGLISMQAAALGLSADAKSRSDASLLVDKIIGSMWADQRASLRSYIHQPEGSDCNFYGDRSNNATVSSWIGTLAKPGTVRSLLVGSLPRHEQIKVSADNVVTVTVCWRSAHDGATRHYSAVAQIAGGV